MWHDDRTLLFMPISDTPLAQDAGSREVFEHPAVTRGL
jgi:hypothetical protein